MNPGKQDRLWGGQYTLILFINLTVQLVHFVLLVTIPLYLRRMGAGNSAVGLSTGLYSISALLFRPLIGHFLDHRGRLWLMRGGLLPLLLGVIVTNFTDSVPLQLIFRVIEGIGFSIVSTTGATIVSDLVPESRIAEGLGYNGMVITIANSLGPLIGLSVIDWIGYRELFFLLIVLSLIPMLVSLLLKESGKSRKGIIPDRLKWEHLISIERGALPASLLMIFSSVSYGGIITFLTPFGLEKGLPNMQFFFMLFPCAVFVSRFITGRLVDIFGFGKVVIPSLILGIGGLILIAFADAFIGFSVAAVLYGLGYGTLVPVFTAMAVKDSLPERRGAANATFYISLDLGIGGGAAVLGFFSNSLGLASIFILSAVFMLMSLCLFPILKRKRPNCG